MKALSRRFGFPDPFSQAVSPGSIMGIFTAKGAEFAEILFFLGGLRGLCG